MEKHNIKVIGVQVDAIERGEDRIAFKETMNKLGIEMPKSEPATTVEEAEKIAAELGYPVVIRPGLQPWAAPAAAWSTIWKNCGPLPAGESPPV